MGEFRPDLVSALVLFHVIDCARSPGVHLVSTLTILYSYEKFLELPIKIPLRKFFSGYCPACNFVKKIDSMAVLSGNHWTFLELLRLTFLKFRLEILKHKTILNYKSIQKSVRFLYKNRFVRNSDYICRKRLTTCLPMTTWSRRFDFVVPCTLWSKSNVVVLIKYI